MTTLAYTPRAPAPRPVNSTMRKRLLARPEAPSLAFLALLALVLSVLSEAFLTVGNLQGIVDQVAVVGIIALAVNQVVLAGEIDISTGSLLAVCAFTAGTVATATDGLLAPLAAALVAGGLVGLLSGSLVALARVPSIIVTLGMLNVLRGTVLVRDASQVLIAPTAARALGQGTVVGVNRSLLVLAAVFIVFEVLSRHTTWGRDVLAVGGNRVAARLAGVPSARTRVVAFTLVGLCVGVASLVFLGQVGQLQATAATGLELQAIAAVVIGGTSIAGGRGSNLAPLVGAVLTGVIINGLTLLRVPGTYQDLVLGALVLAAISADALRRRLLKSAP